MKRTVPGELQGALSEHRSSRPSTDYQAAQVLLGRCYMLPLQSYPKIAPAPYC